MKESSLAVRFHGGRIREADDDHVVIEAAPGIAVWPRIAIWIASAVVPADIVLATHRRGARLFDVRAGPHEAALLIAVFLIPLFIPVVLNSWAQRLALRRSRMKPLVGTLVLERTSTSPPRVVARVNGSVVGPTRQAAVLNINEFTGLRALVLVVDSHVITLSHFIEAKDSVYPERTQWTETEEALREGTQSVAGERPVVDRPVWSTVPLVQWLVRVLDQGPTPTIHLKDPSFARVLFQIGGLFGCFGLRMAEPYWLERHAETFASLGAEGGGVVFGGLVSLAELAVLATFVQILWVDHFNRWADALEAVASRLRSR